MPKERFFSNLRNDYNKDGYNFYGFDKDGFNRNGLDNEGFGRDGFSVDGFDREGYDRDGLKVGYDYGQYKAPGRILLSNKSSLSPEKRDKKRKLSANQAARANAATPPYAPPPPPPPLLPLSPQMPPLRALPPHHTHTRPPTRPPTRSYLNTRSRSHSQPNSKSKTNVKTKKNNNHSKLIKLYEELNQYKIELNVKMTKVNKRINEIENIIFKKPQNRTMTRPAVRQPLQTIQPVAQPIQATVQSNEDGDQMQFGALDSISAGDIFNAPDKNNNILRPGDLGYKY